MPREIITIQVGQCGNQIGSRFWDLALQEHAQHSNSEFHDSMSTFFRNIDSRNGKELKGEGRISQLRARSICVDMEEGVLNGLRNSYLGELFDDELFIKDVSGAGNNWAHGNRVYGPQYHDRIENAVRNAVEKCDSLQCFFLMHSLGGGTGSGLGTYILEMLADLYPDVYKFNTGVFPSADDDVVTSPYNSMFSLYKLTEFSDCVLPLENQALFDMTSYIQSLASKQKAVTAKEYDPNSKSEKKPFDQMNNIAANLLINLTSSIRFQGNLNIDLNEITMNLVPFPKMHFLIPAMSPLVLPKDIKLPPRRLNQMFLDSFDRNHQLMTCDPKHSKYLALGLLVRGKVEVSDINANIQKMKKEIDMVYWNQDGFKVGLCSVPSIGQPYSLLSLSNNACIADRFQFMEDRFVKLYSRQVYVHHYTSHGATKELFKEALESLRTIKNSYLELSTMLPPTTIPRFVPPI